MTYSMHTKMFLCNYYVENGSLSNLSKNAPAMYRKLLAHKKEQGVEDISLTEYLEKQILPHRKNSTIDSSYLRYLFEHYRNEPNLVNADIAKGLETKIKGTAKELGITEEEVKSSLDNNLLFPEMLSQAKNIIDYRAYNNLLSIISINMFIKSKTTPDVKMEVFHDFQTFKQLEEEEPTYAKLLVAKIPRYAGPLTGNEDVSLKVEGTKYYGKNLNLETIPTLLDDILATFKGYTATENFTPFVNYRVRKMYDTCGNLNRIGLDGMNLIEDLDKLTLNLGFNSIKEMLEKEGYSFTPITAEKVSFIPHREEYEVILDDYEKAQILIAESLMNDLKSMVLDQTLFVADLKYEDSDLSLLVYVYEDRPKPVHVLLTKKQVLKFNDKNSLNLTTANLI